MEVYLSGKFRVLAILLELCSYLCEESNVSMHVGSTHGVDEVSSVC